jgi:hypothetical protein
MARLTTSDNRRLRSRRASMPPSPLSLRRCRSPRPGGCVRAWVIAIPCRAALTADSQYVTSDVAACSMTTPISSAVPLSRAKASLERNRRTWAVSPTILAAVNAPQPTIANKDGATTVTRSVISAAEKPNCSRRADGRGRRRRGSSAEPVHLSGNSDVLGPAAGLPRPGGLLRR